MKTIINLGVFLLLNCTLFAQEFNRMKMDSLFTIIDKNNKGMGSVSIFKNGNEIYNTGFGFANVETGEKISHETKFRVGSISKTFTAAIVMQLAEEGKLKLDSKLAEFFPEIPNAEKIKIEDMLKHQSGLYNFSQSDSFNDWKGENRSRKELLNLFISNPIAFEPGEKVEYSNTNYVLLSFIIEDIQKKKFAEVLKERIIEPLELRNTYFGGNLDPTIGEAIAYRQTGKWTRTEQTDPSIVLGAGGIISNPTDLNRFFTVLFNGEIVQRESLTKMIKTEKEIGMGILQLPLLNRNFYGHTGGIDGYNSVIVFLPEENVSIALCSNARDMSTHKILEGIVSIYFDANYELPSFRTLELSVAQLKRFEGSYSAEGFPLILKIFEKDGQLMGQAEGQPSFPLEAYETNKFKFERMGLKLEFDDSKNTMLFSQGPNVKELKRA